MSAGGGHVNVLVIVRVVCCGSGGPVKEIPVIGGRWSVQRKCKLVSGLVETVRSLGSGFSGRSGGKLNYILHLDVLWRKLNYIHYICVEETTPLCMRHTVV